MRGATIPSNLVRTVVCIPLRHRGSSLLCYVKQTKKNGEQSSSTNGEQSLSTERNLSVKGTLF